MSTILRSPGGISSGVATMYFAIWFAEPGEGQALALRSNERREAARDRPSLYVTNERREAARDKSSPSVTNERRDMARDRPSLYVWVKSASKADRVRVRYPKGFSCAIPV